MNFFDQIFLDNSLKNYCIVGCTIIVVLIFKKYFSRYIAALLYRLLGKLWKNVPRQNFINLVIEPLQWLLFIIITVFAIDKLNFPTALEYKIYGHAIDAILDSVGIGIIIISFTWFLLRIIDFVALVLEQKAAITIDKTDDQLVVFFRDFLKVIIAILGFLMLLKACFGQPIGNLLTSLSLVGAAVALAARESLENLIASFIIFFDKPFTTGDTLKVNAVWGTVEKIGLRSTRIRTADKTLVTVPNKQMVDSIVDNFTLRTQLRAEIKLEVATLTSLAQLQKIIAKIKEQFKKDEQQIITYSVYLSDVNKIANTIVTEYFTPPMPMDDFINLKESYYFFIKKILEENNIQMGNADNLINK